MSKNSRGISREREFYLAFILKLFLKISDFFFLFGFLLLKGSSLGCKVWSLREKHLYATELFSTFQQNKNSRFSRIIPVLISNIPNICNVYSFANLFIYKFS